MPTEFLVRMPENVLKLNIFEFDKKLFLQIIGRAMGTVCAPPYANIFMNKIDKLLKNLATDISKDIEDPIRLFKRFLDDIFIVWKGSFEDLQTFLQEINSLHPTIKFTAEFTSPFKCEMITLCELTVDRNDDILGDAENCPLEGDIGLGSGVYCRLAGVPVYIVLHVLV